MLASLPIARRSLVSTALLISAIASSSMGWLGVGWYGECSCNFTNSRWWPWHDKPDAAAPEPRPLCAICSGFMQGLGRFGQTRSALIGDIVASSTKECGGTRHETGDRN